MRAQVLKQYDDHLTAPSWVDLENVPDPKIEKASDVIVRIGGAGVCRTDLHIIEGVGARRLMLIVRFYRLSWGMKTLDGLKTLVVKLRGLKGVIQ